MQPSHPHSQRRWLTLCSTRNLQKILIIAQRIRECPADAHDLGHSLEQFQGKLSGIEVNLAVRLVPSHTDRRELLSDL